MPPTRIAPIWAIEEGLNRMISAATAAMDARSRSGQRVRDMPHTACATMATATSLRPCSSPTPTGRPRASSPYAKSTSASGGRQGKAAPRRKTATIAGPHEADGKSDLAARGARQELAEADEIGIGVFVQPATAHDEFVTKIADVSDRPAEAGDAELEEGKQNFERRTGLPALSLGGARGDGQWILRRFSRFMGSSPWFASARALCRALRINVSHALRQREISHPQARHIRSRDGCFRSQDR